MNDRIEVNTNVLRRDADSMKEWIEELKKNAFGLNSIIEELNKMWTGKSKEVYIANISGEIERLRGLLQETERMIKKISEAVNIYDTCENSVSQEIDEIRV